ncbi:MAG: hypothetical protein D6729_17240 [Deltaproteobacteria bacterium]|nr:MAG: hypothetical protein D6729_17240 [Deltaproteobacteria bacterium]
MRTGPWVSLLVLSLLLGCAHRTRPDPAVVARLERVALVARALRPPVAYVGRGDPEAHAGEAPKALDARLETDLSRAVTPFEVEETLGEAVRAALPEPPPWEIPPALEVASALGLLLARSDEPRWSALEPLGIDAVLDLAIEGWGLWDPPGRARPPGLWMEVRARLLRLPAAEPLWEGRVRVGPPDEPGPRLDVSRFEADPAPVLREGMERLTRRVAERLLGLLGLCGEAACAGGGSGGDGGTAYPPRGIRTRRTRSAQ